MGGNNHGERITTLFGAVLIPATIATSLATAETATETNNDWVLEEVIVTAQRREESLSKVPVAVTAFSGHALEKASVAELTDIAGMTPGLYLSSYTTLSPQIFVRGIGSNDDGITAEGAVGVYLDDVYVGRASSAMFDLYDLERLEVLKGPQGTLYGRNTNGGAINIITRKPDDTVSGALDMSYGNFDAIQVRGYLSGPLIEDKVSAKISGSLKKRDGWTTNSVDGSKVNDEDSIAVRGQLRLTPTDNFEAVISLDYSEDRPTSSYKEVIAGTFFGFYPTESADVFDGAYDFANATISRDIFGGSAKMTLDTDAITFTSITGYRVTEIAYTEDYDSTPLHIANLTITQDAEQFSQEFRAASNGDSKFQWIGGLFYLHDTGSATDFIDLGEFIIGYPDEQTYSATKTDSYAAFGEASYRLTDKLKATVGLRYTYEKKSFTVERFNPADSVALLGFETVAIPEITSDDSFDNLSPKFVLDYQINDDIMVYAGLTKGFKSGGYNNYPFDTATAQISFDPETITSYETGLKSSLADSRVHLNVNAFYYEYKDLQVKTNVSSGGIEVPQIRNAAEAEVYGGEIELTALITPELQFGFTYGFLETKYKDFGAFTGNRLTQAPKHSVGSVLEYQRDIDAVSGTLLFRADFQYTSKVSFSPKQLDILSENSVALLNLRLGMDFDSGWSVALFGKNITNTKYLGHVIDLLDFDLAVAEIGSPRQYGLSVGYRF